MSRRLLYVVSDLGFFVSHRIDLAHAARATGYEVGVACPPAPDMSALHDSGLEHLPLELERGSVSLLSAWRSFRSIWRIVSQFKPDATHLITSKLVILGGIATRLQRRQALAAITGLGFVFTHQTLKARLLRVAIVRGYRAALCHPNCHLVFQNETDLGTFKRLGIARDGQTTLIPGSGVDLEKIVPADLLEQGLPVVLMPSRMLRDKGVPEFVEVARRINTPKPRARFLLLGDPDPNNPSSLTSEELTEFVEKGWVEWHGHVADVGAVLAKAHLVLFPSWREGFPKTLIDAAAAGRAAVTNDVPGCRDAIIDGVTGLLCKPRDVDDMVRSVNALLEDPGRLAEMGAAARAHAETAFDVKHVAARHLSIYNALANQDGTLDASHNV